MTIYERALGAASRVLRAGVGCVALWKESDGRVLLRLYPAVTPMVTGGCGDCVGGEDADPPLLDLITGGELLHSIRVAWLQETGPEAGHAHAVMACARNGTRTTGAFPYNP